MKKLTILIIALVAFVVGIAAQVNSPPILDTKAYADIQTVGFEREILANQKLKAAVGPAQNKSQNGETCKLLTLSIERQTCEKPPNLRRGFDGNVSNRIRSDTSIES